MNKTDKATQLAETIANSLNGGFSRANFCEAMSREHRYLQNEFTFLCIAWLEKCAKMYEQGNYDDRNKGGCKVGKVVTDLLNR